MNWTEDERQELRDLWSAGHSTNAIALRLGRSKNSVVSQVHGLELDGRPSPIRRRKSSTALAAQKPVKRPTLPALPSVAAPVPAVVPVQVTPKVVAPVVQPAPTPVVAAPPSPFVSRRVAECCWPIGEPGTKSFRYCDDTAVPGRPYCRAHCDRAYIQVPAREAAA